MDNWGKFDETTLPPKEAFYSNFNLENISNEDDEHAQKVWNISEIKNRGEFHDLHFQSDTLLLADVFETLEISALKYMNLILYILCLRQD